MSDSGLRSLHFESLQRRDRFRIARAQVEANVGEQTITGRPALRPMESLTDIPALAFRECWLVDRGRRIVLRIGINALGRLPDNDVVLDHPAVSRRHCAIVVHSDGACEVYDVASKNGTLVNGRRIPGPTALSEGDEITLCELNLRFGRDSGNERTKPRPPIDDDECTLYE